MKAIRIQEPKGLEGIDGLVYEDAPDPQPAIGDALVQVRAASFTPTELTWPLSTDRAGHDRGSRIPAHEGSGIVAALGYGAAGVSVGDEVYGLIDGYRDVGAAEFFAVERDGWETAVGPVDLVYDIIGGDVLARSAAIVKPGGALVSIVAPPPTDRNDIRTVGFVRDPSGAQLRDIARLVDDGTLRPDVSAVYPLPDAREAFMAKSTEHI